MPKLWSGEGGGQELSVEVCVECVCGGGLGACCGQGGLCADAAIGSVHRLQTGWGGGCMPKLHFMCVRVGGLRT